MKKLDPTRPVPRQVRPDDAKLVSEGGVFKIWQWNQELFNGEHAIFEQISRQDTALVIPVFGEEIALAEERQPGTDTMLRTLGGRIETGETPTQAAARELVEETGYESSEILLWRAWQPVNKIDWAVYLFIAHDLRLIEKPAHDGGELISLKKFSIESLLGDNFGYRIDDSELMFQLGMAKTNKEEMAFLRFLLSSKIKS